jgi:uncharacterized protein DUF2721
VGPRRSSGLKTFVPASQDGIMNIETAAKTIQLILAPVVMVTACGILLTGMLGHYTAINARIRALTAERLGHAFLMPDEGHRPLAQERLAEIDHQVPMLIRRHHQVHHAILLATSGVVILVISMFVIAAAALAHSGTLGTIALFIFLGGTASLMLSAWFMSVEVRSSHASVAYEAMRVIDLPVVWMEGVPATIGDYRREETPDRL